ncbi:MAG: hypothetical protein SGPRY_010570 [Prymnesium sp.]
MEFSQQHDSLVLQWLELYQQYLQVSCTLALAMRFSPLGFSYPPQHGAFIHVPLPVRASPSCTTQLCELACAAPPQEPECSHALKRARPPTPEKSGVSSIRVTSKRGGYIVRFKKTDEGIETEIRFSDFLRLGYVASTDISEAWKKRQLLEKRGVSKAKRL